MAKRHVYPEDRLYLRVQDINAILATGQGISRVPAKQSDPFRLPRRPEEPTPRVYTGQGLLALSDQMFIEHGMRIVEIGVPRPTQQLIEYFDAATAQAEIDMSQYRHLVKERNGLLREIETHVQRRLFPGWTAPRHQPSPFGENRFRTFDPTPAFEFTAGPLHFIGR